MRTTNLRIDSEAVDGRKDEVISSMKLYSVFVDIGSHSDGWEPEDETDVRFLGTFTTKKRAIQELAKIGYSYDPNDKDDNLRQIIEHELDKSTLMGTLKLSEQEINTYIPQIVAQINKILPKDWLTIEPSKLAKLLIKSYEKVADDTDNLKNDINNVLQYMKDSADTDKARLKRTHSTKKWHFEWQNYIDAMVDCLNLQIPMHHGEPDLNHTTFVYPERQYPCVAYAFNDNDVEYDDPWDI